MWKKLKSKTSAAWLKAKLWVYALLMSLGIIIAVPTQAEVKTFTVIYPTARVDGTPLVIADIQEARITCDGTLVATIVAPATETTKNFGVGLHSCTATVLTVDQFESGPSNVVGFETLQVPSEPPVLQVN